MKFDFALATPADEADLRRLLADNAMPGSISVTFEREPDYFLGCVTMGHTWQVIIAREAQSGSAAGVLCRAVSPHFVNGKIEDLGYIGQLRVDHRYRGRWLLSQGLEFLKNLDTRIQPRAYFAAISDENRIARGVLVNRPRPGFPRLKELSPIVTLGIILRKRRARPNHQHNITRGSAEQLPQIVDFLNREGAKKQLFPAYNHADFTTRSTTRGFDPADFIIARRQQSIVGVIGLWDQVSYKQSVVRAYHGVLKTTRPLYNVGARLLGARPLPAIGEHIPAAYASFICVKDDDRAVFRALLEETYTLATQRDYAYLMLGLSAKDPRLTTAQRYAHIAYHSRLYTLNWGKEGTFHEQLDERIPYIEIAAL